MRLGNRQGLALIAVLWGLVLLSVIAASVATTTRTETRLAHNLVENAKAKALADAGVHHAILRLLSPETEGLLTPEMENPLKLGSEPAPVLRRRIERSLRSELEETLGPEYDDIFKPALPEDGTPYAWGAQGGKVLISVQDEGGKIDLNRASDRLLRGLFVAVGLDPDESAALADAVADFRDGDDLRRLNGAEDVDYLGRGRPYGAKDRPFEATEELGQVLGVTPALYARVAPALTVHSRRGNVRRETAPPLVLEALLGPDALELETMERGEESGGAPATGSAASAARARSNILTIRSEARTQAGAVFVREAVVRLSGGVRRPLRFVAWKQGRL